VDRRGQEARSFSLFGDAEDASQRNGPGKAFQAGDLLQEIHEAEDRPARGDHVVNQDDSPIGPRGFVSSTLQLAVVTEQDIWGKKIPRPARARAAAG